MSPAAKAILPRCSAVSSMLGRLLLCLWSPLAGDLLSRCVRSICRRARTRAPGTAAKILAPPQSRSVPDVPLS